jgi:hypothetical protein
MSVRRAGAVAVVAVLAVLAGACAPPSEPPATSTTTTTSSTTTSTTTTVPADLIPPVLSLPGDLTVAATSAAGAEVSYTVSALDAVDGEVDVTCDPASGSLFAVGDTTVSCSAADTSGNTATGGFTVTVDPYLP